MQERLAIGRRVKILDQKNREGGSVNPPASLRVNENSHFIFNRW